MGSQLCPLEIPAEVAAGGSVNCDHLHNKYLYMEADAFTATVAIQGSVDGDNWQDLLTGVAAGDITAIPQPVRFVRANTTAYTSGTPVGYLIGEL